MQPIVHHIHASLYRSEAQGRRLPVPDAVCSMFHLSVRLFPQLLSQHLSPCFTSSKLRFLECVLCVQAIHLALRYLPYAL